MKKLKLALKIILAVIIVLLLVVGAYVAYVFISYNRIKDNIVLDV